MSTARVHGFEMCSVQECLRRAGLVDGQKGALLVFVRLATHHLVLLAPIEGELQYAVFVSRWRRIRRVLGIDNLHEAGDHFVLFRADVEPEAPVRVVVGVDLEACHLRAERHRREPRCGGVRRKTGVPFRSKSGAWIGGVARLSVSFHRAQVFFEGRGP